MSSAITTLKSNAVTLIDGSFTVSSKEGDRTFTITPDCLCQNEAAQFLATYHNPYYRDGKPMGAEAAVKRTKELCDRFLVNQPWSGYLIREGNKVVGHWTIGYDEKPGNLHLALAITEPKSGIATGVWKWTVERLLPELHAKGFQIPIIEKEEIVKYISIPEGSIRAITRKDHPIMPQLLTRARFQLVEENIETSFGKRELYEARIADLLSSSNNKAATTGSAITY